MPIQRCQSHGLPGYRFGKNGTCYIYVVGDKVSRDRAKEKALQQGRAIKVRKKI